MGNFLFDRFLFASRFVFNSIRCTREASAAPPTIVLVAPVRFEVFLVNVWSMESVSKRPAQKVRTNSHQDLRGTHRMRQILHTSGHSDRGMCCRYLCLQCIEHAHHNSCDVHLHSSLYFAAHVDCLSFATRATILDLGWFSAGAPKSSSQS